MGQASELPDGQSLSHLDSGGRSRMVDVGEKTPTRRVAEAEARVCFSRESFQRVLDGDLPKGGIIEPARLAGLMAAKRTSELIPMCHPLALEQIEVTIVPDSGGAAELVVRCTCCLTAKTGVEMEAMTGASIAALTLYDMTKALDKGIRIEGVRLIRKSGGKSGEWTAQ